MLYCTEKIIYGMKWIYFFLHAFSIYKVIGKFINDRFTDKLEIIISVF